MMKEERKEVKVAIKTAKEELGLDFTKAVSLWKTISGRRFLRAKDYEPAINCWNFMTQVAEVVNHVIEVPTGWDNLKVAHALRGYLKPVGVTAELLNNFSDEELCDFISQSVQTFEKLTETETIHKKTMNIIKMGMDNIDDDLCFDSSKATVITEEIKYGDNSMRKVGTAEGGISRMLEKNNLETVTAFMGEVSNKDDEMEILEKKKENIFRNGFTDTATEKHFRFGFESASGTRQANCQFVEANKWDDVFKLWYEMTGVNNKKDFGKIFGGDEHGFDINPNKFLARLSMRGSNSLNLYDIAPDYADQIKNFKVIYCPDAEGSVDRPYKTFDKNGNLITVTDKKRTVTPGDGQGYIDIAAAAVLTVALRRMTVSEYNEFKILWQIHCNKGRALVDVKEGSRLMKLINKIIKAFQFRHEAKKGMLFVVDIKHLPNGYYEVKDKDGNVTETVNVDFSDVDLIIPESVRKLICGDWKNYPLEICNYLKKKGDYVSLNPQIIQMLRHEGNPNFLIPVVKHWIGLMEKSLTDPAVAQAFHGISKSSDDEKKDEQDAKTQLKLVKALRASKHLLDESQVMNWRKAQYEKMLKEMQVGNILVPGMYTYMMCDPMYCLSNIFNLSGLNMLQSGTEYFNGKDCKAGLFRMPAIHPFEAQKVQLVNDTSYWFYKDIVIFNGFDGIWDSMGGADFDGDTCAVIPEDTEHGKLIVDGIMDIPYDVWEPARTAQKIHIECTEEGIEELIQYLAKNTKRDRTGEITNYATRALNIYQDIMSGIDFAKQLGCSCIYLSHPSLFNNREPFTCTLENGIRTYCMRGYVEAYIDKTGAIKYKDEGIVGSYSFEEAAKIAQKFLDSIVCYLRLYQGEEIDGAKTGYHPELVDFVKVVFTPIHMVNRIEYLGRPVSTKTQINTYISVSPLGRIYSYIDKYLKGELKDENGNKIIPVLERLSNGSGKKYLLMSLLTPEEKSQYFKGYIGNAGVPKTLTKIFKERKTEYGKKIGVLMKQPKDEHYYDALDKLKLAEIKAMQDIADYCNVSLQVIAVAAYDAVYTKNSGQNEGLSYAWLLFDELLSVFSRAENVKAELFKIPNNAKHAEIINGCMYINGNKYISVDAPDSELEITVYNSRKYALVYKRQYETVKQSDTIIETLYSNTTYTINIRGFKYHITNGTADDFERIVANNNYEFDIQIVNGNCDVMVNGKTLARYGVENPVELVGRTVKVVASPEYKKTPGAICNLNVVIVK